MGMVKTYRVLKSGQRVGDTIRNYGDFIPEAEEWPYHLQATWIRANFMEVVYVDEDELAAAMEKFRTSSVEEDEEGAGDEEGEANSSAPADGDSEPTTKKRVIKKKKVKDNGGRDTSGNGDGNEDEGSEGDEGNDDAGSDTGNGGPELVEHSV